MQAQDLIDQARAGFKPVNERIDNLLTRELQQRKVAMDPVRPFVYVRETEQPSRNIQLTLDPDILAQLWREAPDYLELSIPVDDRHSINVSLYRKEFLSPGFTVQTSSAQLDPSALAERRFYHGVVKDKEQARVIMTETRDQIQLTIYNQGERYRLKGEGESYILSIEDDKLQSSVAYSCGTIDKPLTNIESASRTFARSMDNACPVSVLIHVDNESYELYGGTNSAVAAISDHVTSVFNEVVAIYAGINIPFLLDGIMVWDNDDPFGDGSDEDVSLEGIRQFVLGNGIASSSLIHLIHINDLFPMETYSIAGKADIAALCSSDPVGFTQIVRATQAQSQSAFTASVQLFAHELGHNMGARHTHACVWNGNNTAIDNCEAVEDGPCAATNDISSNPSYVGTLMSYCNTQSSTFHPQVEAVILNHYMSSIEVICEGGSCQTESVTCGQVFSGNTSNAINNINSYSCNGWDESGPEVIHEFTTNTTGNVTVTLSGLGDNDLDVFLLSNNCLCSCIRGEDESFTVNDLPAGTYYVVVDGFEGASGPYELLVQSNNCGSICPSTLAVNGNIGTNTYQAAMDLTSDGIVPSGNTVMLKAGNSITLQPNFEVQSGGVLEAVIEGCPTAASSR